MKANNQSSSTEVNVSRANPPSYTTSAIVTIKVGENEKLYYAHKALLTTYSPFFDACLKHEYIEGQQNFVAMKEDNEMAFETFLSWLYVRDVNITLDTTPEPFETLFHSYSLADKLFAEDLKNILVDKLRHVLRDLELVMPPGWITFAHEIGVLDSKLGHFLVQHFAWSINSEKKRWSNKKDGTVSVLHATLHELYESPEVCSEVLRAMINYQLENWPDPREQNGCMFHDHDAGTKCMKAQ